MKKAISVCLLLCLATALLAGCGSQPSSAPAAAPAAAPAEADSSAAVVIKLGHIASADPADPQQVGAARFKETLEERSNGYYKVEVYPAGQLGDSRTMLEGIQMGTLEMMEIENGACGGFVPETMLWDLPFLFRDLEHAEKVFAGELGDREKDLFLNIGVRILAFDHGGFRHFTNSRNPINTPEDMSGLKIRVMESEIMIATINGFGANAVPMAFSELYTALQQHTVDGQENPVSTIKTNHFEDVQKYLSLTGHFYFPRRYVISEAFFQQQSPENQALLTECALEAAKAQNEAYINSEASFIQQLKDGGMEVNEPDKDAFIQLAQENIWPQFYAKLGDGNEADGKALIQKVLDTK